jgi:hypothetical protein
MWVGKSTSRGEHRTEEGRRDWSKLYKDDEIMATIRWETCTTHGVHKNAYTMLAKNPRRKVQL